jgi:hypothetical protein
MVYFLVTLTTFDLRINNTNPMFKKGGEVPARDIAILVDRRSQNRPAVFNKPHGVVCASPEKRNSERGPTDDHREIPS